MTAELFPIIWDGLLQCGILGLMVLQNIPVKNFQCTWEVGQNALIRAYTKDFRNGKTRIRLERQEYPRKSLAYAIEEKLKFDKDLLQWRIDRNDTIQKMQTM